MNADYFIKKFKKLGPELWTQGVALKIDNEGKERRCAGEHCLCEERKSLGKLLEAFSLIVMRDYADANPGEPFQVSTFSDPMEYIFTINDNWVGEADRVFPGLTLPPECPRLRMLYVLELAKAKGL